MTWLFAILVVLALGGVALVAAGKGAPLADEHDDRPDLQVAPDGPVGAEELRRVRFSLAFRGYRMSEVDALLDRLATERETGPGTGTGTDRAWVPDEGPERRGDGPEAG